MEHFLFVLVVISYLPVTLVQKIFQDLLMQFCNPMSKILIPMLKILQTFDASCKCSLCTKGSILVTLDVTSLYSNIPHNDGIKACEQFLTSKHSNSGISTESVCELISTVLTKSRFHFNDDNYLQTMGCAMGTKMAHGFASLFMGKFEEDKLNQYHRQHLIWLRFLDDIFLIWEYSEEELLYFMKYPNIAYPSIKFTYQYST